MNRYQMLHLAVAQWYRGQRRSLWWRENPSPYLVVVSEMMLQQTQVAKVSTKLREFLSLFPSFEQLAKAPLPTVIQAWQGLGYNRRAVYLWKLARIVVHQFAGQLPQERQLLLQLPGIGEYTAAAIRVFAFDLPDIVLDTNVKRVLSRMFGLLQYRNQHLPLRRLQEQAEALHPPGSLRWWYYALMDIGSLLCRYHRAYCLHCPLASQCQMREQINQLPIQRRSREEPTFAGIPRRLWRGKIVQLLRQFPALTEKQLLDYLQLEQNKKHRQWLQSVLQQLCEEQLVNRERNGTEWRYKLAEMAGESKEINQ